MTTTSVDIEWYLAREGQQYGPLSDAEMRKFVELGHLKPTDLVWRQGFPDWRPAAIVFPQPAPPAAFTPPVERTFTPPPEPTFKPPADRTRDAPERTPSSTRTETPRMAESRPRYEPAGRGPGSSRTLAVDEPAPLSESFPEDDFQEERPGRWRRRFAVMLVVLLALGGGGWYAATHVQNLPLPDILMWAASGEAEGEAPPLQALRASPFEGIAESEEATDQNWQQSALWQTLKQNFPEWYQERLKEAVRLKADGKDSAAITKTLADGFVGLRRRYAEQALAASPSALRTLATSFVDNLKHLTEYNVDACYSYISQGETNPQVLDLMKNPDHLQHLQMQVTSVFEAVSDGRKAPQTYLPPRKSDYDMLTQALKKRGWSDADLQLFSDPKALARAKPDVVCKMVQDWFAAQLSIKDRAVQVRLLVESLRPVVAG